MLRFRGVSEMEMRSGCMMMVFGVFAAMLLSLCLSISVFAVQINIDGKTIEENGILSENTTLVPVRGVFEELGFSVGYDALTETAYLKSDDTEIIIQNGKYSFTVNGNTVYPSAAQRIIDGRFYIPLRAVAESVGAQVSWDNDVVFLTTLADEPKDAAIAEIDERNTYSGYTLDYYTHPNMQKGTYSKIFANENGYFLVNAEGGEVDVYRTDENFSLSEHYSFSYELPYFGGYFYSDGYHYLLTGDEAENQYSENTVYDIKQYDPNLNLFHETKLSARYTGVKTPFADGAANIAYGGGRIFITDSCMKFSPDDPDKKQGNYFICLDAKRLNMVNKGIINNIMNDTDVPISGMGAFSVPFADGNAFALCLANNEKSPFLHIRKPVVSSVYPTLGMRLYTAYGGEAGSAFELCGFEKIGGAYAAVGCSVPEYGGSDTKNVFAAFISDSFSKDSVRTAWYSQYSKDGNAELGRVKSVKTDNDTIVILWEEYKDGERFLKGVNIDEYGSIVGSFGPDKYIELSGCDPIYKDGCAIWFCTDNETKKTRLYKLEI